MKKHNLVYKSEIYFKQRQKGKQLSRAGRCSLDDEHINMKTLVIGHP